MSICEIENLGSTPKKRKDLRFLIYVKSKKIILKHSYSKSIFAFLSHFLYQTYDDTSIGIKYIFVFLF